MHSKANPMLVSAVTAATLFLGVACKKQVSIQEEAFTSMVSSNVTSTIPVIGDFETGNRDQWQGVYVKPNDTAAQFAVGTSSQIPVRQGLYAARFTVRPGDIAQGTSTTGERCELNFYTNNWKNYTQESYDDDYYYGWSTYFPTSWTPPIAWSLFMQWHQRNRYNPPMAVSLQNDNIMFALASGHTDTSFNPNTGNYQNVYACTNSYTISNTLNKGLWNDFIVHIKYRPDWTGVVEVWHRVQGQAEFTKKVTATNIPTMQWFDDPGEVDPGAAVQIGSWYTTNLWLRLGFYRGSGGTNTNTLFHDNWARDNSFNKIRARFN